MKIRIKGNSIRYRLTKTEVETFCKTGYFEDTTNFGTKKLTYALQAKEDIDMLDAEFLEDTITLFLDIQKSKDWFKTNQIGFSNKAIREDGTELSLLLEKDFVCMDETVEDQSDNYPNPKIISTDS
jgi:hypothetical protein